MIILTEEINLSSILLILISSSRKKKLICFQSKRNKSAFLQTALSLFSIDLEVLKNEDPYAGLSHKTFNKYELCFQKKYIVPHLQRQLRILDQDLHKKEKSLRHLSYLCSENLSVHIELVLEASRKGCNLLILRKTPHTEIIKRFCNDKGIKLKSYRNIYSKTSSIRKDFYRDRSLLKFSLSNSFKRVVKKFLKVCLIFLKFNFNIFINRKKSNISFNTLAVIHHPPSEYFNEMFWSSDYRNNGRSILGLVDRKMNNEELVKINEYTDFIIQNIETLVYFLTWERRVSCLKRITRILCLFSWNLFSKKIDFFCFAELIVPLIYSEILSEAAIELKINSAWSSVEGGDPTTFSVSLMDRPLKTYGTSWSMPYCESYRHNIYRNDVFFSWGKRQKQFFVNSGSDINKYIEVGYPINNKEKICSLGFREKFLQDSGFSADTKILTYFDNLYGYDLPITNKYNNDFLKYLFEFLEKNSGYSLIIKSKKDDIERNYKNFKNDFISLRSSHRLRVETALADYSPGLISHINLSISSSSPMLICAGYGAKSIVYDPAGYCDDINNEHAINLFSYKNAADLGRMIKNTIDYSIKDEATMGNQLINLDHKTASQIVSEALIELT